MKRYETYKDSGVLWQEKIPSHWRLVSFKRLFSFGRGLSITKADLVEEGIPVISYGQIHSKQNTGTKIEQHLLRYVPESYTEGNDSSKVNKGDFIFADTSEDLEGCGNCVYIDKDYLLYAGYHSIIARSIQSSDNKYLAYLFKTDCWRSQIRSSVNGVKVFSVTQSTLSDSTVILPPVEEQITIASYLDHKVGQIDATIAEKEQMLEDLKAYRSAIISEAVTKGLDKNVEMKDSGIEWMDMIPKHWNINKLKIFADISTGTTPSTDNKEYWKEPTENWYTPSDFCEENVHLETSSRKVSTAAFQGSACRVFKKDVVLVVGIGATLGKIGISSVECSANQQINAIEFYDKVYPLFGAYYLSSLKEVMKSLASAATLAIMNQSVTGSIPFVCPFLDEQKKIADYLEKKTKSIGSLLNQIKVQIDELKSYKSALITEAVTGKIDLRDWKPKEENV